MDVQDRPEAGCRRRELPPRRGEDNSFAGPEDAVGSTGGEDQELAGSHECACEDIVLWRAHPLRSNLRHIRRHSRLVLRGDCEGGSGRTVRVPGGHWRERQEVAGEGFPPPGHVRGHL